MEGGTAILPVQVPAQLAQQAQQSTLQLCMKLFYTSVKVIPIIIAIIIVIYLFYYFAKGIYFVLENKKTINSQWATYRCKPYVLPFAGWLVGPSSTSATDNFTQCAYSMQKSFFEVFSQDYLASLNTLSSIVADQEAAIQDIRNMANYMRNSMATMAQDVYQKLYDAYYRISSLFGVFLGAFSSLLTLFQSVFSTLLYAYYAFESIQNGPIGGVGKFFCFDGATKIVTFNGIPRSIRKLKIGDKLLNNARVTGVFKVRSPRFIYNYMGILVTGDHKVYENTSKDPIKVCESSNAYKQQYTEDYIYCVNTSDHLIHVESPNPSLPKPIIKFADFAETADMNWYRNAHQNFVDIPISPDLLYYQWGVFDKISLNKNPTWVTQVQVEAGENASIYEYRGNVLTGTAIVYDDGKWVEVRSVPTAKFIRQLSPHEKLHHLSTDARIVHLKNGVITRDYEYIPEIDGVKR